MTDPVDAVLTKVTEMKQLVARCQQTCPASSGFVTTIRHATENWPWSTTSTDTTALRRTGNAVRFIIAWIPILYKGSSGRVAITNESQSYSMVRHSGMTLWLQPFVANNYDFAWCFVPTGAATNDTFYIGNDYDDAKWWVGVEASSGRIALVPLSQRVAWKLDAPLPAAFTRAQFPN